MVDKKTEFFLQLVKEEDGGLKADFFTLTEPMYNAVLLYLEEMEQKDRRDPLMPPLSCCMMAHMEGQKSTAGAALHG